MVWLAVGGLGCASAHGVSPIPSLRSTGQRVTPKVHAAPSARRPVPTKRTELYVRCEDPHSCPSEVGLLIVEGEAGSVPERCTITLIAPDRALTATHCLAPEQRHDGAACAQVWLSFPETANAPAETVGCARVLSAVAESSPDALHQEHAVLQLERSLMRGALAIDPTPPQADSIVKVVSVTPHPIYGSTHALTTRLCRAIDSLPAQAALGPAAANVGWLESCPIARGNSGSPVLDRDRHIRAIVHGGTAVSDYAVTSAPSASGP